MILDRRSLLGGASVLATCPTALVAAATPAPLAAYERSSGGRVGVLHAIRRVVPTLDRDRPPSPDIFAVVSLIETGVIERAASIALH